MSGLLLNGRLRLGLLGTLRAAGVTTVWTLLLEAMGQGVRPGARGWLGVLTALLPEQTSPTVKMEMGSFTLQSGHLACVCLF